MLPEILFMPTTLMFLQTIPTAATDNSSINLIASALANGSIGAIMFVIWWLTFKYFTKNSQEKFEATLKKNQEEFTAILRQVEMHHSQSLADYRVLIDKLFGVIEKDVEYKEVLTGNLVKLESIMQNLSERTDMVKELSAKMEIFTNKNAGGR